MGPYLIVFAAAAVANLLSALLVLAEPTVPELATLGIVHLAFVFRVIRARVAATRQRPVELESFRALLLRQRDRG